jgi:NAD(P)-dependent dehydrogenase (short-subunit alcohol dehydrogenase family)
MTLAGKRVVVAGGAGGMGAAIAASLLREGADLVLADRDSARLAAVAAGLGGDRVTSVECDLTSEEDVRRLAQESGEVNGLVNVQGTAEFWSLELTTLESWRGVVEANLTSTFLTCREIGGAMASGNGGSIVNFASTAGFAGVPRMVAYTAAKHGVVGLTRALAVELGRRQVRVNCVCPGATLTPMLLATPDEYREARIRRVPLGRLAEPTDQAAVVAFLLSDASRYTTGTVIPVDGGVSALAPGTAEADIQREVPE